MNVLDKNFSYGYDDVLYSLREDSNAEFQCFYTKASRQPLSFLEECVNVCNDISDYAKANNRIPTVLLSGGLDSEVVVRSFLESGRDFRIVTNRFKHDLNSQEIEYIKNFASAFNLDIEFNDIDIVSWLTRSLEAIDMAEISKCTRPEMLPTMKLMNDVYFNMQGTPVLGNGDFYASKEINPQWRLGNAKEKYSWMYIEYEYILAWMRYAISKGIVGSINFFQQTPEIVLAMATHPLMQNLIKNNPVGKQSTRSTKYLVYKSVWPDIKLRPKFHGGEKIESVCDKIRKLSLNKKYYDYTVKWKMPVDEFVKMLKT